MRKSYMWCCDFETTTTKTEYFKKNQDVKVIAWYLENLSMSNKNYHGISIESWFETLTSIPDKKIYCYFHNLNFDGDFILKFLTKHFKAFNLGGKGKTITGFGFLRQNAQIYEIKVYYNKKEITILCSLKILSSSIENLGEDLGIAKHNEETQEDNFYDREPFNSVQDLENDKAYFDYLKRDVHIMKASLDLFIEELKNLYSEKKFLKKADLDKYFTIGSLAYFFQKSYVNQYAYEHNNFDVIKGIKINEESYKIATKFYFGGLTQFNAKHQYQLVECPNGIYIDINSAHPNSMSMDLPYGNMINFEDEKPKGKHLEYLHLHIDSAVAKTDNFYCLANWNKVNGLDNSRFRYMSDMYDFDCYYLKQEWEMLQNFYDFEGVEVIERWWCKCDNYFNKYINDLYFYKQKYNDKKAIRSVYKTLLNSSYGKHATREAYNEIFVCDSEEDYNSYLANGKMLYKDREWEVSEVSELIRLEGQYLLNLKPLELKPELFNKLIAATITAYTRIKIFDAILKLGVENFMYCDTDSIFVLDDKNLDKIEIHESKLGAWKVEKRITEFISRGSKAYRYVDKEGKEFNTFSGINKKWLAKNVDLAFYETEEIFMKEANLKIVHYPSGIALVPWDYTTKERKH